VTQEIQKHVEELRKKKSVTARELLPVLEKLNARNLMLEAKVQQLKDRVEQDAP
jgi:hypothetical protein